ncbi:MAG: hypothetical protein AAGI09_10660 [Pseudomonadota bacterium]
MAEQSGQGDALETRGWQVFDPEPPVQDWVAHVRPTALGLAADPDWRAKWLRHGGTWFAGVNALPNDGAGRVDGGPALAGTALSVAQRHAGPLALDPAQISVTYPGYPRRDPNESETAHRFRLRRDAAHLDGLLPVGPERRRFIAEPAAFILGYPLTAADPAASPLVVWEGSHHLLRTALRRAMVTLPPAEWRTRDVTEVYTQTRREVFARCKRVPLHAPPGGAILLHRLTLHGVAPWAEGAGADPAGRAIAYFRPDLPGGAAAWLSEP